MKNFELKPNTCYNFSEEDYEFIIELTKVGYVKLSSYQVSFMAVKDHGSGPSFDFKDIGVGQLKECLGLSLPEGWAIEYIYGNAEFIKITFGVKH